MVKALRSFVIRVKHNDDPEQHVLVHAASPEDALKIIFERELRIRTSIYPKRRKLNALSSIPGQTQRTG